MPLNKAQYKLSTVEDEIEDFEEAEAEILRRIGTLVKLGMTYGEALALYVDIRSNIETETWAKVAEVQQKEVEEKGQRGYQNNLEK